MKHSTDPHPDTDTSIFWMNNREIKHFCRVATAHNVPKEVVHHALQASSLNYNLATNLLREVFISGIPIDRPGVWTVHDDHYMHLGPVKGSFFPWQDFLHKWMKLHGRERYVERLRFLYMVALKNLGLPATETFEGYVERRLRLGPDLTDGHYFEGCMRTRFDPMIWVKIEKRQ